MRIANIQDQQPQAPQTSQPTLAKNLRSYMDFWDEWERGINGRKPAKDWNEKERGGGDLPKKEKDKIKQTYYRRKQIWKLQQHLINKGDNIYQANNKIMQVYGASTALSKVCELIIKDKKRYNGLYHPNLR